MSRIRILAEGVANNIAAGDSKGCGKEDYSMDGVLGKSPNLASGAKAQLVGGYTQGLKPLPPKETAKAGALEAQGKPEGRTSDATAEASGAIAQIIAWNLRGD